MKHFFTLTALAIFLISFVKYVGIDDVIAAMKTGNSAAVAKFLITAWK